MKLLKLGHVTSTQGLPKTLLTTASNIRQFNSQTPLTKDFSGFAYSICSQAKGPLRRPSAPPTLREPSPPQKHVPPTPSSSSPSPLQKVDGKSVVTMEFQRHKAKELQEYFKQKKLESAGQDPIVGFQPKNEISNGRWSMFSFAVEMLIEYATGSDLVDQVKILLSNFGIIDLE